VSRNNAGRVVEPTDTEGFLAAAGELLDDEDLRARMGADARAYAEATFDLEQITDEFERILRP
jgi:glycosyltransferase involved in cell wall biosynthesis